MVVDEARSAISRIVGLVGDAEIDLDGVFALADAEPMIGRVFALKVFEAVPGVGKVQARRKMALLGIDGEATLSSLTTDVRLQIVDALCPP